MKEKKPLPIRIMQIVMKIISAALLAFTVFIMVFTIISVRNFNNQDRNILGYQFWVVRTDSMSPSENNKDMDVHFSAGDIVISKRVDPTTLKEGDVITFMSMNPDDSAGQMITHMIRKPSYDKDGKLIGYVTFGTNTGADDESPAYLSDIKGVYVTKIPKAGHFFAFVKTKTGYIYCILIPFLLLILVNGVDVIRLFRKYKKEQTDALNAEKEEIAAERARNEDMLRELLALKEQLAGGAPVKTDTPPSVPDEPEADEKSEADVKAEDEVIAESPEAAEVEAEIEPDEPKLTPEEEEAARKKAEAARKRRETIARKKAEAEAEAARLAAEEEAARLAEEEAARKKAEAARKRKETIARKKAEAARLAAENNASDSTEATEDSSSDN